MPANETIEKYFTSQNNLLNTTIHPIQSKWVVAMQMRSVGLLQQSTPFGVAILYIMVQNSKFSFIIWSLKSKEIILFPHN